MPASCFSLHPQELTHECSSAQVDLSSSSYDTVGPLLSGEDNVKLSRPFDEMYEEYAQEDKKQQSDEDDKDSFRSESSNAPDATVIEEEQASSNDCNMTETKGSSNDDSERVPIVGSGKGDTIRRCNYCGATSTPMWRHGPGEFTNLCNSCGVKWRRGKILQSKKYRHHLCKGGGSSSASGNSVGRKPKRARASSIGSTSGSLPDSVSCVVSATGVSKRRASLARTPRQSFASLPSHLSSITTHLVSPSSSSSSSSDDAYSPPQNQAGRRLKRVGATPPQIDTSMVHAPVRRQSQVGYGYETTPMGRTRSVRNPLGGVYTSNVYTDPAATAAQYRHQLSQHSSLQKSRSDMSGYGCLPTPPVGQAPLSPFHQLAPSNVLDSPVDKPNQGEPLKLKLPRLPMMKVESSESERGFKSRGAPSLHKTRATDLEAPLFDSLMTPTSLDDRPYGFDGHVQVSSQTWLTREDEVRPPLSPQVSDRIQKVAHILSSLDGSRVNSFVSILSKAGLVDPRRLGSGHEVMVDVQALPASTFVELETLLVQ